MKSFILKIFNHSFGQWSLAFLMISLFSGVFLIIPYNIEDPYGSIVNLMIANPFASFFRNLHYWSSQLFLITILVHIFDHLLKKTEKRIKTGIWFRLIASIVFIYLVMLSGFVLKADTDSKQAWEILNFLISSIPFIGENLAYFILGQSSDSLLIPYLHHVATFSIIIIFVLFEHAKQIWPKSTVFIISAILLFILSSIFSAPLHTGISPVLKGPWYFVGFQEILHWMSHPLWSLSAVFLLLLALFLFKFIPTYQTKKKFVFVLIGLAFIYLILTVIGFYFRGENWKWENRIKTETEISNINSYNVWDQMTIPNEPITEIQQKESCMWCHSNSTGFTASHDVNAIGCSSCHLGNKLSTNKDEAHQGMELFPGNFSNASLTCGTSGCHPNELNHIQKSLMTTNSGLVAVNKYVFNESDNLDELYHIQNIKHSPAETHLRNLCSSCHLGQDKIETGPIHEKSRGGGCLACHLNYPEKQLQSFNEYHRGMALDSMPSYFHPQMSLDIGNDKCFGCHSRSGRISTSYEGWHETKLSHKNFFPNDSLRLLEDKRVFELIEADVHHLAGLTCIDCHQYKDVMGDGNIYAHQEEAVKISCQDCHQKDFNQVIGYNELEREEKNVFDIRGYIHHDLKMISTQENHSPIVNSFIDEENNAYLLGKTSKEQYLLKAPPETCTAPAHSAVSCALCHSSWVPQCIGCHNEFDKNDERGYDLLDRKQITGEWNEFIGEYFNEAPVIGVRENGTDREFIAAAPGMIMTIDTGSFNSIKAPHAFLRLYAPVSPHTTQIKGRDCKSCHLNSLSLGFGRGELHYEINGQEAQWKFESYFAPSIYDGLPEDAWTDFVTGNIPSGKSTRSNFRSLNKPEQNKMLLVGACLQCHDENSNLMKRSLSQDFNTLLSQKTNHCILPSLEIN